MTTLEAYLQGEEVYFNSHPHEEDDIEKPITPEPVTISTHILTKRMTFTDRMSL